MKTKLCATILALSFFFFFSPILLSPSAAETDVSEKIGVFWEGTTFDRNSGTTNYALSLRNYSSEVLSGPFRVVVEQIDNSHVSVINPDGYTSDGKPYFIYNKDRLVPWGKTASKVWKFGHQCKRLSIISFKEIRFFKKISQWECSWFATCYTSIFSGVVTNHPPVAEAGSDRDVTVGDLVTLDGRNSYDPDEDLITYNWSITGAPAGSTAALDNPASVVPTFTPDKPGIYTFSLIVSDGKASSAPDFVQITAALPNVAPTANAGPDQSVITGSIVNLDGSWSFDPDGDPLTYYWQILSKPEGSNTYLSDPNSASPNFLADQDGDYFIQLTVSDGDLYSLPDDVILVSATPNAPPVSYAGDDQTVSKNSTMQLDGRGSSDPNNDTLTYSWTIVSKPEGSTSELNNPASPTPQILADKAGDYVFTLIVYDGELYSNPDTVVIKVVNDPPIAEAGPDQEGVVGVPIALNGSGSSDPNGDTLTYLWSIISAPTGSSAAIVNPTSMTASITPDPPGIYAIQLVVNDGSTDSAPDAVNLTVRVTVPNVVGQTQASAEAAIIAAGLTVGAVTQANSAVVPAGNVISQNPAGGTLALAGSSVSLTVSLGPVMVTVPNVVGMAQAAVESAITTAGLAFGTITGVYSDTVPAGSVISQNPIAGVSVVIGSPVDLVISLGPLMAVTVPNVVGQPQASAEAAIIAAGLTLGTITQANSTIIPAGSVISQAPASGTSVTAGSPVYLVVSLGPAQVTVPNVVGISQAEAQTTIAFAHLTTGAITTTNSLEVARGNVISQAPSAGSSAPEGSSVSLVISLGPPLTTVPDVLGFTQEAAQSAIVAAGLNVGTVTSYYHDTVPTGNVISQKPAGGSSIAQGSTVNLLISLGPSGPPPPENGVLLEGPPDAPAMSALRDVDLISSVPANEIGIDAIGREVARTELLLKLAPNVTVGAVNGALTRFGARVIWMTTKVPYLLVRVPDPGTLAGLEALIGELQATAVFERVLRAYFPTPDALPENFSPSTLNYFDVIDHLLGINAPAAWNARAALRDKEPPTLLIADWFGDGPPRVPPFAVAPATGDYSSTTYDDGHGYHVLGIAAADFGGALATGGLPTGLFPSLPSSPLPISAVDLTLPDFVTASGRLSFPALYCGLAKRLEFFTGFGKRVVINTSLHYGCAGPCPPEDLLLEACTWVDFIRAKNLEDKFIHATSAGNIKSDWPEDDAARINSPFAAAALLPLPFLEPNLTNTIVVENVVGRAFPPYTPQCLKDTSKIGGHLSAVGTDVDSYVRPEMVQKVLSGTSMATPQVAALAAYVWSLNPNLTPVQLKDVLLSTAREVTLPNVLPANCKAGTPAPRINAYGAVLAADEPVALSAAGTPADAPTRSAILDVADSNGVEGGDKKFDQGDLKVLLDKIPQGVGPAQSHWTGYDWSRYDLNGDGHTGADWCNRFNLDINKPATWTYITAPEDPYITFNESCVTDLQVMCYYAYSPLYKGSTIERDNLLQRFCGRQKTWYKWSQIGDSYNMKLGADGRGNVFAAWQQYIPQGFCEEKHGYPIFIGHVGSGQITPLAKLSPLESLRWESLEDFFVDKMGNMFVVYKMSEYGITQRTSVCRYNVDYGWDTPVLINEGLGVLGEMSGTQIAADSYGNAIIIWSIWRNAAWEGWAQRYDISQGWQSPVQVCQGIRDDMKIAMDSRGNAIVVWSDYNNVDGTLEIRAKRYRTDSGWEAESRRIAAPDYVQFLNIVMDSKGNAIVTWYNPDIGIRARHYDINAGWQPVINIASNPLVSYSRPYHISMDESGNAMVIYWEGPDGQESLMSRGYSVDQGWDDNATTVIEAVFETPVAFSMHGGGNATLITSDLVYIDDNYLDHYYLIDIYAYARQYRAGKGWDTRAINTVRKEHDGLCGWGTGWGTSLPSTAIIDRYGNATAVVVGGEGHYHVEQCKYHQLSGCWTDYAEVVVMRFE